MNEELIKEGVGMILQGLGVDESDRNFKDTPERVVRVYKELFESESLALPEYEEEYDEMVILRGHVSWGICPHHLLPVKYVSSLGYIPTRGVIGLSKLARIVDTAIDGPILQESLAPRIVDRLMELKALGAGCVVIGEHGCMRMRGVRTMGDVVTSAMRGVLLTKPEARSEFLNLISRKDTS